MSSGSAVSSAVSLKGLSYEPYEEPPTEEDFLSLTDSKVQYVFKCKNAELLAIWKKFDYVPDNMTHKIIRIIEDTGIPKFVRTNRSQVNEGMRIEKITLDDLKEKPAMWGIDKDNRLFIATKRTQTKSYNGKITKPYLQLETFYQSSDWAADAWVSRVPSGGDKLFAYYLDGKNFPLFENLLRGKNIEFKSYNKSDPHNEYIFKAKLAK